jgi:hypothetical protein
MQNNSVYRKGKAEVSYFYPAFEELYEKITNDVKKRLVHLPLVCLRKANKQTKE